MGGFKGGMKKRNDVIIISNNYKTIFKRNDFESTDRKNRQEEILKVWRSAG